MHARGCGRGAHRCVLEKSVPCACAWVEGGEKDDRMKQAKKPRHLRGNQHADPVVKFLRSKVVVQQETKLHPPFPLLCLFTREDRRPGNGRDGGRDRGGREKGCRNQTKLRLQNDESPNTCKNQPVLRRRRKNEQSCKDADASHVPSTRTAHCTARSRSVALFAGGRGWGWGFETPHRFESALVPQEKMRTITIKKMKKSRSYDFC